MIIQVFLCVVFMVTFLLSVDLWSAEGRGTTVNFGKIPLNQPVTRTVNLSNEKADRGLLVESIYVLHHPDKIKISSSGPVQLDAGSTLLLRVTAQIAVDTIIIDTIEFVSDDRKVFLAEIRIGTDEPIIQVSDIDYGEIEAMSNGEKKRGVIRNIGVSDLVITGYDEYKMNGTNNFFDPRTDFGHPLKTAFPVVLSESDSLVFWVWYSPMGELAGHTSNVAFYSNARTEDSICILNGKGILTSGIDDEAHTGSLRIQISPSPASASARIEIFQAVQSPFTISITDVLGRQYPLLSGQGSVGASTYPVDVSAYEPGSYVLQVSTDTALSSALFTIVR